VCGLLCGSTPIQLLVPLLPLLPLLPCRVWTFCAHCQLAPHWHLLLPPHWLLAVICCGRRPSAAATACVLHLGACIILGLDPCAFEATMREKPLWPASLVLSEAKRRSEDRDLHVL
jgi:hypothetical protein